MSDDWRCVFRHDTPWDELQRIIDEDTRERLLLFLAQRLDDPDFSDSLRARMWATAAPVIRTQTRAVFERAWRDLQLEMLPAAGPVQ